MATTALEKELLCTITIQSVAGHELFSLSCAPSTVGELKERIAATGHIDIASQRLMRPGTLELCEDAEQVEAVDQSFVLINFSISVDDERLRQAIALYRSSREEFKSQYGSLGALDVSQVTDMSHLFEGIHDESLIADRALGDFRGDRHGGYVL